MGSVDRPPNIITDLRGMKGRIADLERRQLGQAKIMAEGIIAKRQYAEALDEVSTTSAAQQDLGGPAITIEVPEAAFIRVFAEVEMKVDAGGPAAVYLADSLDGTDGDPVLVTNANDWTRMRTSATGVAGTTGFLGQTRAYPATAGEHVVHLLYAQALGGSPLAYFRNRRLWVEVF